MNETINPDKQSMRNLLRWAALVESLNPKLILGFFTVFVCLLLTLSVVIDWNRHKLSTFNIVIYGAALVITIGQHSMTCDELARVQLQNVGWLNDLTVHDRIRSAIGLTSTSISMILISTGQTIRHFGPGNMEQVMNGIILVSLGCTIWGIKGKCAPSNKIVIHGIAFLAAFEMMATSFMRH